MAELIDDRPAIGRLDGYTDMPDDRDIRHHTPQGLYEIAAASLYNEPRYAGLDLTPSEGIVGEVCNGERSSWRGSIWPM